MDWKKVLALVSVCFKSNFCHVLLLILHLYVSVFILQKWGGLAHWKEQYLSVTVYSAYASSNSSHFVATVQTYKLQTHSGRIVSYCWDLFPPLGYIYALASLHSVSLKGKCHTSHYLMLYRRKSNTVALTHYFSFTQAQQITLIMLIVCQTFGSCECFWLLDLLWCCVCLAERKTFHRTLEQGTASQWTIPFDVILLKLNSFK